MRHFYSSHGKHCYLRSFQTSCPRCGADVLYWECTHGSKVFFEYPPYGKLIRHICSKYKYKNIRNKYPVIIKRPKGLLEKPSPSCPVCGKLFRTEKNLKEHLKQLKKNDPLHNQYFKNKILIEENLQKKIHDNFDKFKIYYKSKFGTINIKRRNK